MLSEYYITVEDFDAQLKECDRRLVAWKGVNHIQRNRFGDLGQDMVSFSESFLRTHMNATMWQLDSAYEASRDWPTETPDSNHFKAYVTGEGELDDLAREKIEVYIAAGRRRIERMTRQNKSLASTRSSEATRELMANYKAFFFFIRAFQDACYGVLLNLVGSTPGKYSSMNKCISKQVSPVFSLVNEIPGYVSWFNEFKNKRDHVKLGVNFSLCGPQWDVGVSFNLITPEGGLVVNCDPEKDKFRLRDLISAFHYSTALVEMISHRVPNPNNALNADAEVSDTGLCSS